MAYQDANFSADATVDSVLAQVHRRTARYAVANQDPSYATSEEDTAELRGFLRQGARNVAIRTGRVIRSWTRVVSSSPVALPSWARGGNVSSATLTTEGGTPQALEVVHDTWPTSTRPRSAQQRLVVTPDHKLILDPAAEGTVTVRVVARTVLEEGTTTDTDELPISFPPELGECLVRYVLAQWFEDLSPEATARHMVRYEHELNLFEDDHRQTGFAPIRRRRV